MHIEKPHNQYKYISMISIQVETIDCGGEKKNQLLIENCRQILSLCTAVKLQRGVL